MTKPNKVYHRRLIRGKDASRAPQTDVESIAAQKTENGREGNKEKERIFNQYTLSLDVPPL
jgi:hypothetical protein